MKVFIGLHLRFVSNLPQLATFSSFQRMLLRKAAMALLLMRFVTSRRSLSVSTVAHHLVVIRAFLSKYPLLAQIFAAAERAAAALLLRARGKVDRATNVVASKIKANPIRFIASTRLGAAFIGILLRMTKAAIESIAKVDAAMRALAPFARFRIVCNILRRRAVFEGMFSFKWMDDVELALLIDAGCAPTISADSACRLFSDASTRTHSDQADHLNFKPQAPLVSSDAQVPSLVSSGTMVSFAPQPPPPPPPPPPFYSSPPLMSSPAFAAALQSAVLNKTPKPTSSTPSARSIASPGMPKGDDLMAALVARISARRRRLTSTVTVDSAAIGRENADSSAALDWSDETSAETDVDQCPSPKRFAAEIVKRIPWSNGRTRVDPSSVSLPSDNLSGMSENYAVGAADDNCTHSRSETPVLYDLALDLSGVDKANCSSISASSSTSSHIGKSSCIGSLMQPEPFALGDFITSRRGSRGNHPA